MPWVRRWWAEHELACALGDSRPTVLVADERLDRCMATCERLSIPMIGVRMKSLRPGVMAWDPGLLEPTRGIHEVAVFGL